MASSSKAAWSMAQERRTMLLLAASTTLYGLTVFFALGNLMHPSGDADEGYDDEDTGDEEWNSLQLVLVFFRVWFFTTIVVGAVAVKGALQVSSAHISSVQSPTDLDPAGPSTRVAVTDPSPPSTPSYVYTTLPIHTNQPHLPSLRLFTLHTILDTALTALTVFTFAVILFSPSTSAQLSRSMCTYFSHRTLLESFGVIFSPGSGMENCEEKWNYGIAPMLLITAGVVLWVRAKTAILTWNYYRDLFSEGRISLEMPPQDGTDSTGKPWQREYHSHPPRPRRKSDSESSGSSSSATTTGASPPKLRIHSNSLPPLPGRHSRSSSSASTIRPGDCPGSAHPCRIMLLPADYENVSPSSLTPTSYSSYLQAQKHPHQYQHPHQQRQRQVSPTNTSPHLAPSSSFPESNYSTDSVDTVHGSTTQQQSHGHTHTRVSSTQGSRKRAMSYDPSSNQSESVIVYAPILMSIAEAQSLGGREAVIAANPRQASSQNAANTTCMSPTAGFGFQDATPRQRNSPPPPRSSSHSKSQSGHSQQSQPQQQQQQAKTASYSEEVRAASPFYAIKGYRDAGMTEMDSLSSSAKTQ